MHTLKYMCLHRCLCWRSDRVAVCIHLLPPALPTVSAHRLPPALRQSGCSRPHALLAPSGQLPAHRQCHHPPPGGLDWRAGMTSGHHRDFPQHPQQAARLASSFPVTDWPLVYIPVNSETHTPISHAVSSSLGGTYTFFVFFFLNLALAQQPLKSIFRCDEPMNMGHHRWEEKERKMQKTWGKVVLMAGKEDENIASFLLELFVRDVLGWFFYVGEDYSSAVK